MRQKFLCFPFTMTMIWLISIVKTRKQGGSLILKKGEKMKRKIKFDSILGILILATFGLGVASCGKKGGSIAKYDGYAVESFDDAEKKSDVFPEGISFDINGTKFETQNCWLQIKSKSASIDEITSGGQSCSFARAAQSYKVTFSEGTLEKSKSPDGKHDLITVKMSGTTGDGAKYQYVFKGRKS